jgi:hypothetical protein
MRRSPMKRFIVFLVPALCMVLAGAVGLPVAVRGAAALDLPPDAKYLMTGDGTVVSILSSGECYRSKILAGGTLAQTIHLGNFWEAVAGLPVDPIYEIHENGLIIAIDADGNVYRGGLTEQIGLVPASMVGNFWAGVTAAQVAISCRPVSQ